MNVTVAKTKTTGRLRDDIERFLAPLGGISQYVKPGQRVLLKPNFNTADPYPASSALDFLEAVIEIVKTARPSRLILGDSCTISQKTQAVMEQLGIFELGQRLGVEVLNFDKSKFITKKIPGKYLTSVRIPAIVEEVDKVILLPCLKTHRYGRFTVSLKMAVGLMKKVDRILLHAGHLEEKIAEINLAYRPDLIILDGRSAFVTNGPESGELVEPNILMASPDRMAIDVEGVKILKSYPADNKLTGDVWQLPQIKRAAELGLGVTDETQYRVLDVSQKP